MVNSAEVAVRTSEERVEKQKVVHRNDLFLKNGGTFTTNQLRLFLYVVAQLPRMLDMAIPAVSVPLETLRQILNLTGDEGQRGNRLRQILKDLASVPAAVVDGNGGTILTTWFDFIRISQDGKTYIFQLQTLLQPFFMQLSSQFTVYELGYVLMMTSAHTVRLYDTLKTAAYRGSLDVGIDELKQYLGLVDYDDHGQAIGYRFPKFKRFNSDVLKPSVDEINEKTDLTVRYMPLKDLEDRRKIIGVRFWIETKDPCPESGLSLPPARYGKAELIYLDKEQMAKNVTGFARDNTVVVFQSIPGPQADSEKI